MNNQVFLYDLRINFNLREPKKSKETPVYAVISINKKQYKIATGVKVLPAHWSKKKQMAIINNSQTKIERNNNNIANKRIIEIKFAFEDFCIYFCENPNFSHIEQTLKDFLNMNKKIDKTIYATGLLQIAFDLYYKYGDKGYNTNKSRLDIIKRWVNEKTSNESNILNQKLLNRFVEYDKNRNIGVSKINGDCSLFARLINKLTQTEKYCDLVQRVKFDYIEDVRNRREEEYKTKKGELKEEEIELIKSVELDERLNEYRDIFLLHISAGQRASDIHKLFEADVNIKDIIKIDTQKEGINAHIRYENVKFIVEKYKSNGFRFVKFNSGFYGEYNKNIKIIAQKAGLNRMIKYYDPKDLTATKLVEEPLYKVISTHYARHTFITKEFRKGVSEESIALQSGHKSTKSLNTYKHITADEKEINMLREYEVIEKKSGEIINQNKKHPIEIAEGKKDIIEENKEVLLMLGENPYKVWQMKNEEEVRTLLSEWEHKTMSEIGIDKLKPIKDIFNEKIDLEERKKKIEELKSIKKDTTK